VPTIPFRDLEIQRRDDDLVGATFGRGFYVLDDYRALREIAGGALEREAWLFGVRDAWWYVPFVPMQAKGKPSLGSTDFAAPNPPFGAVFTYWLAEDRRTAREERRAREEELREREEDTPFPGWERLAEEALEEEPRVLLTVRDADGRAVRRIEAPADRGLHRVAWDLRLPPPDPVSLEVPGFRPPWVDDPRGPLAPPGRYTVEMALVSASRASGASGASEASEVTGVERLGEVQSFTVKPVVDPSFGSSTTPEDYQAIFAFQQETRDLLRRAQGAAEELARLDDRLAHLRAALAETPGAEPTAYERLDRLEASAAEIGTTLTGDRVRRGLRGGGWGRRARYAAGETGLCAQEVTPLEAELTDRAPHCAGLEVFASPIRYRGEAVVGGIVPEAVRPSAAPTDLDAPELLELLRDLAIGHGTATAVSSQIGSCVVNGRSTAGSGRPRLTKPSIRAWSASFALRRASSTVSPSVISSGSNGQVTTKPPSGWGSRTRGSL